jgi:hypothetical protein
MNGSDLGLTGLFADAAVISSYTRADAIADGILVDVTEWASADKGFHGGFRCPVALTRALWSGKVDVNAMPKARRPHLQDTRGRAHDVLWMASLALRGAFRRKESAATFRVKFSGRYSTLRVVADGDGITIGFPEDM